MYCVHKYIVYISSLQVAPWELLTDRGLPPGHPIGHHKLSLMLFRFPQVLTDLNWLLIG